MTREEALLYCKDLWEWLAQNPEQRKKDSPFALTLMTWQYGCPCCEYVSTESPGIPESCQEDTRANEWCKVWCPLIKLWPKGCLGTPSSPYRKYVNSGDGNDAANCAVRAESAAQIGAFAYKELVKERKAQKVKGVKKRGYV